MPGMNVLLNGSDLCRDISVLPSKSVEAQSRNRWNPIIFRTNMEAGHGGASGRFERLHETAFAMAFALKVAGAAQTPPSASLPLPSAPA